MRVTAKGTQVIERSGSDYTCERGKLQLIKFTQNMKNNYYNCISFPSRLEYANKEPAYREYKR